MKFFAPLALILSACAQTYSSHSGWNFTDTLQTSTDVLVADVIAGSAIDNGSQVTVKAKLHAVRILSGSIAPGADFELEWHYQPGPMESPAITTKVPQARGLWFLRNKAEGRFEPLQTGAITPMGGRFLPLGAGVPSYAATEPLQTKIADEIAAGIENLVSQHAADLTPHKPEPPVHGVPAAWVQTRNLYQSLQMALQSLDTPAADDVYRRFSTFSDPNLKVLGIFGRLRIGDTSAAFDLETNLASIASTFSTLNPGPPFVIGLDLSKDLPAAHALARMALSDNLVPGLEDGLAFSLARTRSPEFLPYLIAMLGSPNPGIRGSTLMSFCQLLGPVPSTAGAGATRFWQAEMASYCPDHSPLNDRELEQKETQFWQQWWESHREEIAKIVTLPTVTAPSRYSGDSWPGFQITQVPTEVRFEVLLHMTAGPQADHYHAANGTIVEGPAPAAHDPVSQQLNAADREMFHEVIESVNAKLAGVQARSQQMLNAARIAGTLPGVQQSRALDADRQSALKIGLDELRVRLSPEGWQTVERFLRTIGIGMVRAVPVK